MISISNKGLFEIYRNKKRYNSFYYDFRRDLKVRYSDLLVPKFRQFICIVHQSLFGNSEKCVLEKEFDLFERYMLLFPDKDFQEEAFYLSDYLPKSKRRAEEEKKRKRKLRAISREHYNNVTISFYDTEKWKWISKTVKKMYGTKCMKCGNESRVMHADHIKPRSLHPSIEFDIKNIQILCDLCNVNKGNSEEIDYRSQEQIDKCNRRFK